MGDKETYLDRQEGELEVLKKEITEKERKIHEQLQNDIQKRREQLLKESRTRRSTVSELSPRHLSSSNSEDMKNVVETCEEHRRSDTINIPQSGRRFQQGACLGHSQKGCINYSGIDLTTGQLVYITEWTIKNSQMDAKNLQVDEVIEVIEKKVADLSMLRHKHLIGYECVLCVKKKDHLQILLVQEFLLGISIFSISGGLGWCSEGASMVAKGVLEALIFLHNNGVSHGNILDSTVFMDNSGNIRVTDFSLVPYLQELISGEQASADLPSLGTLIETLMPTPHPEMRDFINRCKSGSDLLDHHFLYSMLDNFNLQSPEHKPISNFSSTAGCHQLAINSQVQPIASDRSWLQERFITIELIGEGAFGSVIKVCNRLDEQLYAIKRIPLSPENKINYTKTVQEVKLLSTFHYEHIVRYYSSWIETDSESQFLTKSSESDDGIEFVDSQGQVVHSDEESSESDKNLKASVNAPVLRENVVLFIQMEFCEKSTLRTAIDVNLYQDEKRLWRLFREIAKGLNYIHHIGIIHRDLKPDNIFLDSKDHVKIGDFGLATAMTNSLCNKSQNGQIGTALYVSPEHSQINSEFDYSPKDDLYSLGIIFFEMCTSPPTNSVERKKIVAALRMPEVELPEEMASYENYNNKAKLLKWLLRNSPKERPTSAELLQSGLVPQIILEDREYQDMLRSVEANKNSRVVDYCSLVFCLLLHRLLGT